MKDRTPMPRDQRAALPAFSPVPRLKVRHDGWTPERQRAFIEGLADTGSVETACRMVNMSTEGAYGLRRHPQAGEFRAAWDAALACGWQRLKDEAFERALNGQLVPVFVGGKLIGYRRKKNDRLLMFILRHYGPQGPTAGVRPLTVNVINATANATVQSSPAPEGSGTAAPLGAVVEGHPPQAITAPDDPQLPTPDAAETVARFEGVPLDAQAQAELAAILEAAAARHRARLPEDDPSEPYIPLGDAAHHFHGEFEIGATSEDAPLLPPGEVDWTLLGDEERLAQIDQALERMAASPPPAPAKPPRKRKSKPALPPPAVRPEGERYSESMPWLSDANREGVDQIDAMIEAAKAKAVGK
ncbi:hypothetical protein [Sphingomonas sp.]|jgi:hypothetical protein|uniref:hypothetical protein n=1 Tax=Sphingomonas sp. TaxID=28214 RepID=UPI002D7ED457|nr:hypothetical protein [Sphingomonas sp.]HEU0044956.1 hypothetical protein [Sphingomonas sp.]